MAMDFSWRRGNLNSEVPTILKKSSFQAWIAIQVDAKCKLGAFKQLVCWGSSGLSRIGSCRDMILPYLTVSPTVSPSALLDFVSTWNWLCVQRCSGPCHFLKSLQRSEVKLEKSENVELHRQRSDGLET